MIVSFGLHLMRQLTGGFLTLLAATSREEVHLALRHQRADHKSCESQQRGMDAKAQQKRTPTQPAPVTRNHW